MLPSRRKLKKHNKLPNSREKPRIINSCGRETGWSNYVFFVNDKGRYYRDFEERKSKKCLKWDFLLENLRGQNEKKNRQNEF